MGCHKKKWLEAGSGWVGRSLSGGWSRFVDSAGGVHRLYVTEPPPEVGVGWDGMGLVHPPLKFAFNPNVCRELWSKPQPGVCVAVVKRLPFPPLPRFEQIGQKGIYDNCERQGGFPLGTR
jgi:hypothetical protein